MVLWGGRFEGETEALVRRFGDSFPFDRRLYAADIAGSIAYAKALERTGIITPEERAQLVEALERVRGEFEAGAFSPSPGDEDVHTAVERRLTELLGEELAGKLHTGRSRNDQVTTDLRLWLLERLPRLEAGLTALQGALVAGAEEHLGVLMPGYTHLRQAQPLLLSHWLMSHFWRLSRDRERLEGLKERLSVLPLGSGALAGNPWGIDREYLARELGFARCSENSLDAVSDRDYVAEFLFFSALLGTHLSQLAEDLILFSAPELGFLELPEGFCTGSSLMPQKVNPDPLELLRGRAGRLIGTLCGFLTTLKGLPSGYNKDLQEDKEPLFFAMDTLELALPLLAGLVQGLRVDQGRTEGALREEALATELADYLVTKGIPFRTAHRLVGKVILRAAGLGCSLKELPLEEYRKVHPAFASDLYEVLDFHRAVERRDSPGGTATARVQEQIQKAKELLRKEDKDDQMS